MPTGSSKHAAFCIVFALAGAARADGAARFAFELAQDTIIVREDTTETLVKVGCEPRSFAAAADKAYALCGSRTIVEVDALPTPHVALRTSIADRVISLTVIDGVLDVRTASGVKPLADYPPLVPRAIERRPLAYATDAWRARQHLRPPPPRVTGVELDFGDTVGPGFDGPAGVTSVFDAAFVWRPEIPISLSAFGTFGAATGEFQTGDRNFGPRGGDVQIAVGEGLLGVDTRYVGFSFGAGAAMFERGYSVEPLIVARGRFGALDELAFSWHTSFATSGPTLLGVIGGVLEFRLARRAWLAADVELGNLRYGHFMGELRVRLHGDGPNGTLDLRMGLGLAYVESSADCNSSGSTVTPTGGDTECLGTNVDYLGPAASLGVVFRP